MLELIIIGFIFWAGYQSGGAVTSYRLRHLIYKEAKRLGLTSKADQVLFDDSEETPDVLQLVVEKANNILYLYERGTDNFICQGSTIDELATLAQKYKNVKYAAVMYGEQVYAFVNGTVKTEKEVLKK